VADDAFRQYMRRKAAERATYAAVAAMARRAKARRRAGQVRSAKSIIHRLRRI